MGSKSDDAVAELLIANLPRDLVMGIEDALTTGGQRAHLATCMMDKGHLAHAFGQVRHFHCNEAFHRALSAGNVHPTPISGNSIVTGVSGIFRLGRFNIPPGMWMNGRRSQTRRQLALANKAIEQLVQPDIFSEQTVVTEAVAFFVTYFTRSVEDRAKYNISIEIAVPDRYLKNWIFRESLKEYLRRYEIKPVQQDLAKPRLRRDVNKRKSDGEEP